MRLERSGWPKPRDCAGRSGGGAALADPRRIARLESRIEQLRDLPTLGFSASLGPAETLALESKLEELRRIRDQTQARIAFLEGPPRGQTAPPLPAPITDDAGGVGELVRVPAEQVCHVFHPIAEASLAVARAQAAAAGVTLAAYALLQHQPKQPRPFFVPDTVRLERYLADHVSAGPRVFWTHSRPGDDIETMLRALVEVLRQEAS